MPIPLRGAATVDPDMGAVAALVYVGRVSATPVGLVLARSVDERDVDGEVAAQVSVEVRGDVWMAGIETGVDDADEHTVVAALSRVRCRRVDHVHVPLS